MKLFMSQNKIAEEFGFVLELLFTPENQTAQKKIKMNSATPVQDFHSVSMSKWNWAWVRI